MHPDNQHHDRPEDIPDSMSQAPPTGVLGLGLIGSIWARHLEADGVLAAAWNRTPQPGFPRWRPSPASVAEAAEILMLVVADPAAVRSVLGAVEGSLTDRHTVVQCSTIDPASSRAFEALVRSTGAGYVEAPFTGSKPGAETRKTIFYLGGPDADIAQIQPVLDRLSHQQSRWQTGAEAAAFKLAANLAIAAQIAALCEALALARANGIRDEDFFPPLGGNMAWSGVMNLKAPKLQAGDYTPQFSVRHMRKDIRLARNAGIGRLPVCDAVLAQLDAAFDRGWGEDDFAAVMRLLETKPA
jgi:3-hydroxyisobutyrate dehydrogenase-like beta-hydroxyacid dehydrogenase